MMQLNTVPLHSSHKKTAFKCGISLLDNYLHKQAKQDVKRKLAACFVLINEGKEIIGYYTLSNLSVVQQNIPEVYAKKYPSSYTKLPVTLLGRLAVDERYKGKGMGQYLLIDALLRSFAASASIGSIAVVTDPINESARSFYTKFGFISLINSNRMFLPMKTIEQLLRQKP